MILSYPCFDSYDYANEDRYYTTCILCDNVEDAYKKYTLLSYYSFDKNLPKIMGSVLYYDSGKDYLAISGSIEKSLKDELLNRICNEIEALKKTWQCPK